MANRPPSVRSFVRNANVREYIPDPVLAAEVARSTGAYRAADVNIGRRRLGNLGAGSFGAVSLESLRTAGAPTVAVKRTIGDEDYDSFVTEVATLRYLQDMPNVAQLVGVTRTRAPGNVGSDLPVLLLAPAKASLYDMIHKPATNANYLYQVNAGAGAAGAGAAAAAVAAGPIQTKSWSEIKSIALQVLRGYHVLHSWGIVHRDTKPGNMLLTSYGEVQITDFGMSRYFAPYMPVVSDGYTGTIRYSSPEMLLRQAISPVDFHRVPFTQELWKRNDAWAVGASLYELITGDSIFDGNTYLDVLNRMFYVKGSPVSADAGIVHTLYQLLPASNYLKTHMYPDNPNGVRNRLLERARVKSPDFDPAAPDADSELKQLVDIVDGLLTYNSERRLTIEGALGMPLFGGAPTVPPRPIIHVAPMVEHVTKNQVNTAMTKILFDWLYSISAQTNFRQTMMDTCFVMDRTINYVNHLIKYIYTDGKIKAGSYDITLPRGHPKLLNRNSLQAIGCVGYFITRALFTTTGSPHDYDFATMRYLSADAFSEEFMKDIFNFFMEAPIPYFGRTMFDLLLESDPLLPTLEGAEKNRRLGRLSILNNLCYFGVYDVFKNQIPLLHARLHTFADNVAIDGFYNNDPKRQFLAAGNKYKEPFQTIIDELMNVDSIAKKNDLEVLRVVLDYVPSISDEIRARALEGDYPTEAARLVLEKAAHDRRRHAVALLTRPAGAAATRRSRRRNKATRRRRT